MKCPAQLYSASCRPYRGIPEPHSPFHDRTVVVTVHDRMPVILHPDSYDLWLDPGMQNVAAISELMKPDDARLMRCYPVSSRVNHVANDDEDCSRPVEFAPTQNRLFS